MGKGDKPRPQSVTNEELDLRKRYARGEMTLEAFKRQFNKLRKQGKIKRSGRIIR